MSIRNTLHQTNEMSAILHTSWLLYPYTCIDKLRGSMNKICSYGTTIHTLYKV